MPVLVVNGQEVGMITPDITGVTIDDIGKTIASATNRHHDVRLMTDIPTGDF